MNCEQDSSILNTNVYKIKNISNHGCVCLSEPPGEGAIGALVVTWEAERKTEEAPRILKLQQSDKGVGLVCLP